MEHGGRKGPKRTGIFACKFRTPDIGHPWVTTGSGSGHGGKLFFRAAWGSGSFTRQMTDSDAEISGELTGTRWQSDRTEDGQHYDTTLQLPVGGAWQTTGQAAGVALHNTHASFRANGQYQYERITRQGWSRGMDRSLNYSETDGTLADGASWELADGFKTSIHRGENHASYSGQGSLLKTVHGNYLYQWQYDQAGQLSYDWEQHTESQILTAYDYWKAGQSDHTVESGDYAGGNGTLQRTQSDYSYTQWETLSWHQVRSEYESLVDGEVSNWSVKSGSAVGAGNITSDTNSLWESWSASTQPDYTYSAYDSSGSGQSLWDSYDMEAEMLETI
ncbi:MAG: hypothetical protein EA424_08410, partial [Planctomycetaceae bacterium]